MDRLTARDVIAAGPPWFGLPAALGGWRFVSGVGGGSSSRQLGLSHQWDGRWLEVDTEIGPPNDEGTADWSLMSRVVFYSYPSADITPDSFPIRFEIERFERSVPVDGRPVPFVVITDDRHWCARARIADRNVDVQSRGFPFEELELVTVDPGADYEIHDDDPTPDVDAG